MSDRRTRFRWISLCLRSSPSASPSAWSSTTARDALQWIALGVVGLILVLQVINVVTDSIRYRMVLPERYRAVLGRWSWHRIFAIGRLLNAVIPQAGMAYRAAHLRIALGIPVSSFFGSVAVVTWLGNGMVMVFAGIGVLIASSLAGALILGLGLVVLALIILGPRLWVARGGRERTVLPSRVESVLARFGESFVELAHRPRQLRAVIGMSLLTQFSGAAAFVLVCTALDIENAFAVGAVIYSATTVIGVVSLTPAGIGITELAAGLAGGLLDIGAGVGVLVALVIRITGIVSVGLLAGTAAVLEARDRPSEPHEPKGEE